MTNQSLCLSLTMMGIGILMMLTGCQEYHPQPIDLKNYNLTWQQRSVNDESVALFAQRMHQNNETQEGYDPSDGLSLSEAEAVLLCFNRDLRLARLEAKVPLVSAENAGQWEDPEFGFDYMRVLEDSSKPWVWGVSLSFTIPLSGRLEVEKDKAWAQYDHAWRQVVVHEWQKLTELRLNWRQWSATQQKIKLTENFLKQLSSLSNVTETLAKHGELKVTEARVLVIDQVTLTNELNALRNQVKLQQLQLKELMGLTPDASVKLIRQLRCDAVDVKSNDYANYIENHPQLKVLFSEYEVAEQTLRREIKKQYPDLVIGPSYENDEGQSKIGLGLGIPIPAWNRNKQGIAEAGAARDSSRSKVHSQYEKLTYQLVRIDQQQSATRKRIKMFESKIIPLVDQQIQDMRKLIEVGEMNVLLLQDALEKTYKAKYSLIELQLELSQINELRNAALNPRWATDKQIKKESDNEK